MRQPTVTQFKSARTKFALRHMRQARLVVPFSDFKMYQQARRYNADYRAYLKGQGKKFFKRQRVNFEQSMVFGRVM